jgi:hypothetical protein
MADNNPDDDIYDDPDTIGDLDDDVNGQPDDLPPSDPEDPSESIYEPEKHTTDLDDRGDIDELEIADRHDTSGVEDEVDPAYDDDGPSSQDGDDFKPASEVNADEQDGADPA